MKFPIFAVAVFSIFSAVAQAQTDVPGRIQAEDYTDYSDRTRGNTGGQYRNDDVDIQVTSDAGGGHNVGWISRGESLSYDLNVTQAGEYEITFRVASRSSGGRFDVLIDGDRLPEGRVRFNRTDGWQNWINVSIDANLALGNQTLRLDFTRSGFNLNYIDFDWQGTPAPTPQPTAVPTPVPTTPPSTDCQLPYFADTQGRCVRAHRLGNAYCLAPSAPWEQKLTASQYTTFGCATDTNRNIGTIAGDTVTAVVCPRPYERNSAGNCVLRDKGIECRYNLRINERRNHGPDGTRIEYVCGY